MKSDKTVQTITFTTKGQLVIPLRLRQEYGIKKGTKAAVMATPDGILLKPITSEYLRRLRGSLKGKGVLATLLRERRRERER
jgi:AbrB family looped-hinge helix DNA binding protein